MMSSATASLLTHQLGQQSFWYRMIANPEQSGFRCRTARLVKLSNSRLMQSLKSFLFDSRAWDRSAVSYRNSLTYVRRRYYLRSICVICDVRIGLFLLLSHQQPAGNGKLFRQLCRLLCVSTSVSSSSLRLLLSFAAGQETLLLSSHRMLSPTQSQRTCRHYYLRKRLDQRCWEIVL